MTAGYRWDGADLILQVRARPRAGRDEWAGLQENRFRVRITAPPVEELPPPPTFASFAAFTASRARGFN